jgi:RNA polymerase-associated protein LEO1
VQTWELPLVDPPQGPIRLAQFRTLLDIESHPYNADKFTLEDTVEYDEEGVRIARAPVLNRIRWRLADQPDAQAGALQRESNARFVRWDDGSLSLFLGNECVDVTENEVEHGRQVLLGVYHEDSRAVQVRSARICDHVCVDQSQCALRTGCLAQSGKGSIHHSISSCTALRAM